MEIAIVVIVLLVVGLVVFFVARGNTGRGMGSLLGADALRAKFATTATVTEASTP